MITYNNHEPIIPQELWDRVQARQKHMAQGRKTKSGFVRPLSGFLVCADCGSKLKMSGHSNKAKTEYLISFQLRSPFAIRENAVFLALYPRKRHRGNRAERYTNDGAADRP